VHDGFWRDRLVAVTGGAGFIGRRLVARLVAEGACVRVVGRYTSDGETDVRRRLDPACAERVDVALLDIADARAVRAALGGTDTVFHLAALIGIPYSYIAPASYVSTNVLGTLAVLEAARDVGIRRLVHTSTSEVYGTARTTPITEEHPLQGQSPYSASKIAADKLAESYFRSFGLPIVTLRPFNTFGPGQSPRAVIPTILRQLLGGCTELRIGSLSPRRDLTYVDDTVAGFLAAGRVEGLEGDVIHLGTGTSPSVGELVELCMEIVGRRPAVRVDPERVRPAASEVELLLADPSKAGARLGWSATVTIRDGIERTAESLRGIDLSAAQRYAR